MIIGLHILAPHRYRCPKNTIDCHRKEQVYEIHLLKLAWLLYALNSKLSKAFQYLHCDHDRTDLYYNFDLHHPTSTLLRTNLTQHCENLRS